MENTGVGRIDASAYVARFDQMPSWESRGKKGWERLGKKNVLNTSFCLVRWMFHLSCLGFPYTLDGQVFLVLSRLPNFWGQVETWGFPS
jgi:hypothetical protein